MKKFKTPWQIFSFVYAIISTIVLLTILLEIIIRGDSIWTHYFRYWTFESNIFITILFYMQWVWGDRFAKAAYVKIAAYVFITLTGIIYWTTLFPDSNINSWQDYLIAIVPHSITPLVGLIEFFVWWRYKNPSKVSYWGVLAIIIVPLVYAGIGLSDYAVRGTNPTYFFFDYHNVGRLFLWFSLLLIAIGSLSALSIFLINKRERILKLRK